MAGNGEEAKGSWYQVPTWDGSPLTWRAFRREMRWWVSSLDLASTAKYNLAARWLLRQTGIVRQRGEEFNPEDLAYKPAEMGIDPTTNDEIEITPPDYLRGLNKLLDALESINGQTVLDKRGELRSQFYLELQRKPGERLSEFCTRFRTLVADLQAEQVHLPASELGWFLKNKIGLDPLRRQLLETALQGREEYNVIEAEVLRLFKDLHLADPLHRKFGQGGDKPRLSIRRMFQSVGPSSSASSSASTISRSPSMFSSASSFRRPSTASVSSAPTRKVYMAEVPEEGHEDGPVEEVLEASAETAEDVEEPGLVDFLQSEAECLATELQAAEEQGADPDLLQSVEADFEQAAEALVTMKEARSKLQELRKDRGFGKPSPGGPAGGAKNAGVPAARKASGRHPCFDCNQHGHWAGDKECPKPGAGLGRKPLAVAKAKPRQVRVTEALHAEHDPSTVLVGTSSSSPPSASLPVDPKVHEASMVNHVGSLRLDQALDFTINNHRVSHAALIAGSPPASQVLSEEKILVGALDSACNRTCCGEFWLDTYVEHLKSSAPAWITNLIVNVDETERFKFGNGGTVPSTKRWRIPICLGQKRLLLLWISVVPISSLGCLLGRDFMDALGAVLDFGKSTVEFRFIQLQRLDLAQMSAGHFMLPLQPAIWPRPGPHRWRKCGLDGIVELQLQPHDWLQRRLAEGSKGHPSDEKHEHLLTESSVAAASSWHELHLTAASSSTLARDMKRDSCRAQSNRLLPLLPERPRAPRLPDQRHGDSGRHSVRADSIDAQLDCSVHGACGKSSLRTIPVEKVHPSHVGSCLLARTKLAALVGAALTFAVLAFSLPCHFVCDRLEAASADHGGQPLDEPPSPLLCHQPEPLHGGALAGAIPFPGSSWVEVCLPGGYDSSDFPLDSADERAWSTGEASCIGRSPRASPPGDSSSGSRDFGPSDDRSSWWTTTSPSRPCSFGLAVECRGRCEGHDCQFAEEDSADCGHSQAKNPLRRAVQP